MLAISAGDLRATARPQGIDGPLFLGRDTHALSEPAERTSLEVLAANGVDVVVDAGGGYTPTPVDLARDPHAQPRRRPRALADGIVVTPSHNPPEDGGFKYNPPHGGPADTDVTGWIEARANALLEADLAGRAARRRATPQRAPTRDYLDRLRRRPRRP